MKTYSYILIFTLFLLSTSCEDAKYLDRFAVDAVQLEDFFKSENDLELAVNNLYTMFLYNPSERDNIYYLESYGSDNVVSVEYPELLSGSRIVPTGNQKYLTHSGWNWGRLRDVNFILDNYHKVEKESARAKYSGIARWFRAYFYFDKVKNYGDVPWIGHVIKASEGDILYKERDPRGLIIDSVLMDLDYAINNLPAEKSVFTVSKYAAMLLKARVGLFEGTYRKYHGLGGYEKYLQTAESAAKALIESNAYTLYSVGGPNQAYRNLFVLEDQNNIETILAEKSVLGIKYNKLGHFMTTSSGSWSLPKDLVNSYLMSDGSRFTDIDNYQTIGYFDEMQNRDPRLTQTTAGPDFKAIGSNVIEPFTFDAGITGYRIIKALPSKDQWGNNAGYTDIIIMRYAEALLAYAEAKAELGSINQNDLDISVNKIRDRVGMPHLFLNEANNNPDPYLEEMYPNVDQGENKGLILEIRRERRIELYNEGLRWDDLMRWAEGKKMEKPLVGIYFPGLGAYDMNNDGIADVYIYDGSVETPPESIPLTGRVDIQTTPLRDPITGQVGVKFGNIMPHPVGKFTDPRDYLYPIPQQEINLNPKLFQNPGW